MVYDFVKKSVPSNLNKLEIARFIYIKLGSILCFTTKNPNNTKDFYSTINSSIDPTLFSDVEINCNFWSQIYSRLLFDFGINNKIVNYMHKFVVFYIDNIKWIADATFGVYPDLSRIHYHDTTSLFGPSINQNSNIDSNVVLINDEDLSMLNRIDEQLGYLEKVKNTLFFKKLLNFIRDCKEVVDNYDNQVICKLDFLFNNIGTLSFGYYESKCYVYNLEQNLLTSNELTNVKSIEFMRVSNDSIDRLQCIYSKGKNYYRYYLLCPMLPIKSITYEQLRSLSKYGFSVCNGTLPNHNDFSSSFNSDVFSMDIYDFNQANERILKRSKLML